MTNSKADKPTQEQIKRFWEWCGLKGYCALWGCFRKSPENCSVCTYWHYRKLDLNNLFKYAVPKALSEGYDVKLWSFSDPANDYRVFWFAQAENNNDLFSSVVGADRPEDALFLMLNQMREASNAN